MVYYGYKQDHTGQLGAQVSWGVQLLLWSRTATAAAATAVNRRSCYLMICSHLVVHPMHLYVIPHAEEAGYIPASSALSQCRFLVGRLLCRRWLDGCCAVGFHPVERRQLAMHS
jgi:hypothetical protein